MKRLITPLFVLLTLSLIAALLVQERQAQNFDAELARLNRELIKREQQCKQQSTQIASLEANQKILKAEAEALRERVHAVASASSDSKPDAAPSPTPIEPKPGFTGMLRKMMADPQMKKALVQQQMTGMRQYYADFIKQAGLSPAEAEKFFALLGERQGAIMEAGAVAGEGKSQSIKDYKEELKALLGEEHAAQFEGYEKTLPDRMGIAQLNQQLASTSSQLNDSQTNSLIQISSEERSKMPASPFKPGGTQGMDMSPEEMDQYFQQQADLNQRINTRAMSLLTPQQMEKFTAHQQQFLEMQKMGIKMAKEMLGTGK